jgi:hypothetical protein
MAARRGEDRWSIVLNHLVLATGLEATEAKLLQEAIPGSVIHNDGPRARYVRYGDHARKPHMDGKGTLGTSGYFAITAQVETQVGSWKSLRQVPTFYLRANVQGILTEDQAVRIAQDVLLSAVSTAPKPTLHVTAVRL